MVRRAAEAGGERRGEAGRQGEAPEAEVGGERRGEAGRQSEAPEADSGGTQAESGEARLGGKARHRRRGQAESVARGGAAGGDRSKTGQCGYVGSRGSDPSFQ